MLLVQITNHDCDRTVVQVHEVVELGRWNAKLTELIPNAIVEHILSKYYLQVSMKQPINHFGS